MIGCGSFGSVLIGTHLKTDEKRAIKIIPKNRIKSLAEFRLKAEIKILMSLVYFFNLILYHLKYYRTILTLLSYFRYLKIISKFI